AQILIPIDSCHKTSEDADLRDVDSLSVSKMEISETVSGAVLPTESCNLKDTPPITEPASDTISYVKDNLGESQYLVSADDDSRIISSDGLENAKDATDGKGDRHSLESFDLSKPPPESSGLVDCNLTLESSTNVQPDKNTLETNKDSTDSTSRSHSVVLHYFPSRGKVHDLLDERIGETLSQVDTVSARHSTSSHMWGADLTSESISQSQTSKTNFLQLFPEDKANDIHGMGNWDSILRDPRLHFTSWRSPRELAKQWEEEQSKLLSTKPSFHTKRSRPTNKYNLNNLVNEPQVSLRYGGRSTLDPLIVNGPTRTGQLPHWLREVVSFPPRPVEQDAMSSGLMQWINKTFSNSDKTMGSITPGFKPSIATHSPDPVMYPVATHPISKPDEVIVIDSDASSEDTRSDDHRIAVLDMGFITYGVIEQTNWKWECKILEHALLLEPEKLVHD
nr:SANT/Myb domain, homeodomain-like protein [Tanacetum cinerariifolium]